MKTVQAYSRVQHGGKKGGHLYPKEIHYIIWQPEVQERRRQLPLFPIEEDLGTKRERKERLNRKIARLVKEHITTTIEETHA